MDKDTIKALMEEFLNKYGSFKLCMKKFVLVSSLIVCVLLASLLLNFRFVRVNDDAQPQPRLVEGRPLRFNPRLEGVTIEINSISNTSLRFTIYNESEHGIFISLDATVRGWLRTTGLPLGWIRPPAGNTSNFQVYENDDWWTIAPLIIIDQDIAHLLGLPPEIYIDSGGSAQILWDNMDQHGPLFRYGMLHRMTVEVVQATYYIICDSSDGDDVVKYPFMAFGECPYLGIIWTPTSWEHPYFHDIVAEFIW